MLGNSLVVQWLGLGTFTALGLGSISCRGTRIPKATWRSKKKQKKNLRCLLPLPINIVKSCKNLK